MLFFVTQTHAPEDCPVEEGGTRALHADPATIKGLKVLGGYGAYTEHTLYYLLDAESYAEVDKFLEPGLRRCIADVTPVSHFLGRVK